MGRDGPGGRWMPRWRHLLPSPKVLNPMISIFCYIYLHWHHKNQPNVGNMPYVEDMGYATKCYFQKWTLRSIRLPINWHIELQWPARQHCVGPMWLMLKCSLQWMCLVLRWLVVTPRGQQKTAQQIPLFIPIPLHPLHIPLWHFLYPTQGWHRPHACANWIQVFEICEGTKEYEGWLSCLSIFLS